MPENVGHLVCPASHDLSELMWAVLLGVTESGDKPLRDPAIFNTADVVATRMETAPSVGGSRTLALKNMHRFSSAGEAAQGRAGKHQRGGQQCAPVQGLFQQECRPEHGQNRLHQLNLSGPGDAAQRQAPVPSKEAQQHAEH